MIWWVLSAIIFVGIAISIGYYIYYYRFTFSKVSKQTVQIPHPSSEEYEKLFIEINAAKESFRALKTKDIYITSFDGLRLHGSYLETDGADKLIIMFHGYRSKPEVDFSCAADFYQGEGFNILFVDQRSHGLSEGKQITFGVKERHDVCSWVEHMRNELPAGTQIYISGMSMGATTVMLASSLVTGVSGIIADCGFVSPKEIIQKVAKENMHMPKWITAPIGWLARIFGGFDYSTSTLDSLSKSNIPIVIIHGKADDFVPYEMSQRNYDASISSNKRLILVDRAAHGFSFLFEKERYQSELRSFIKETSEK